jgi:MFS transporter, DHA2 family, multidrug resistance protein
MTGWLASTFGRKRLLMMSVTGFTLASFFCGLARPHCLFSSSFVSSGALVVAGCSHCRRPSCWNRFPPDKRGQAMAFWALGFVVAPMLGPVAGGWLTDNYSWRWVFYINVPIGILAIILLGISATDLASARGIRRLNGQRNARE